MRLSRLVGQHEFWLSLLVVAPVVGLSISTGEFLSLGNLMDVAASYAILSTLACELFVVPISDGIDISFPAMTAIAQYAMANWVISHGGSFALALVVVIVVGLLLGLTNSFLVYWLHVPAIIIAITTLSVHYGLLVHATKDTWLYGSPGWFTNDVNWFSLTAADGYDYGLTLSLLCLTTMIIFTAVLTNYIRLDRQVYAMDSNCDAVLHLGLSLLKLHFYVYGYMDILADVTAVIQAQVTQSVAPNLLLSFELTVLAATALDGTSTNDGRGTLTGTPFSVVLLAFLQNGLTLLSVSPYWHIVFNGVIILASISAVAWNEERKLTRELWDGSNRQTFTW